MLKRWRITYREPIWDRFEAEYIVLSARNLDHLHEKFWDIMTADNCSENLEILDVQKA